MEQCEKLGREQADIQARSYHKRKVSLDNIPLNVLILILPYNRYPTFVDALRDIDDALCLVTLFASLPSNPRLPASIIQSCARLSAEWQLYVMHTRALRKVFLSIKGIYYQAEVQGQTITWLVPFMFTQSVNTILCSSENPAVLANIQHHA